MGQEKENVGIIYEGYMPELAIGWLMVYINPIYTGNTVTRDTITVRGVKIRDMCSATRVKGYKYYTYYDSGTVMNTFPVQRTDFKARTLDMSQDMVKLMFDSKENAVEFATQALERLERQLQADFEESCTAMRVIARNLKKK